MPACEKFPINKPLSPFNNSYQTDGLDGIQASRWYFTGLDVQRYHLHSLRHLNTLQRLTKHGIQAHAFSHLSTLFFIVHEQHSVLVMLAFFLVLGTDHETPEDA